MVLIKERLDTPRHGMSWGFRVLIHTLNYSDLYCDVKYWNTWGYTTGVKQSEVTRGVWVFVWGNCERHTPLLDDKHETQYPLVPLHKPGTAFEQAEERSPLESSQEGSPDMYTPEN